MLLYGLAGTLFAYCVSLFVTSPLAAFAAAAGYQVIMFLVRILRSQLQLHCSLNPAIPCRLPLDLHIRENLGCGSNYHNNPFHAFLAFASSQCGMSIVLPFTLPV